MAYSTGHAAFSIFTLSLLCQQEFCLTRVSHSKLDTSVSNDLHPNVLPRTAYRIPSPAGHRGKLATKTRCEGLAPSITPRRKRRGCCHTIPVACFTFNVLISVQECQKRQGHLASSQFAKSSLCHKSLIPEFQPEASLAVGLNIYATQRGLTDVTAGVAQFNAMPSGVITSLLMSIDTSRQPRVIPEAI